MTASTIDVPSSLPCLSILDFHTMATQAPPHTPSFPSPSPQPPSVTQRHTEPRHQASLSCQLWAAFPHLQKRDEVSQPASKGHHENPLGSVPSYRVSPLSSPHRASRPHPSFPFGQQQLLESLHITPSPSPPRSSPADPTLSQVPRTYSQTKRGQLLVAVSPCLPRAPLSITPRPYACLPFPCLTCPCTAPVPLPPPK